MNENAFINEPIKTNKKNRRRMESRFLYFRWLLTFAIFLYVFFASDINVSKTILIKVSAIFLAYSILITLYIIFTVNRSRRLPLKIAYVDIVFTLGFCYITGGINSDIYVILFFLISYCVLSSNTILSLNVSIFTALLYTITCFWWSLDYVQEFNEVKLFLRDFLLIIAGYGIKLVSVKVKRVDEMHKKEFKLARTDKLTGLANRHYFDQKLSEEAEYSKATGKPVNIIMFDLDNFKKFNDSYGHVWGDKLLTLFADIIKQNIRSTDVPVRYGGEEFLILVRDLDIVIAKNIAERIRSQLEKQHIYIENAEERNKVTVSGGVAQFPKHAKEIKNAIDCADKALYQAKGSGKNIVVSFDEVYVEPELCDA